ncbi:CPBP family intramembrane glutamic endopeptidase [Furfurilactobacillus sp. WILCCON 0119]|uniref:CPBP family intramembrane glutamic endopeptidase n=1 Tax=Furfurilactobacillus entadae TaxID=2922307 RepID=UPI0035EDC054
MTADQIRRYLIGVGAMFGLFVLEQLAMVPVDLPSLISKNAVAVQWGLGILTTILSLFVLWVIWRVYQKGLAEREPQYFRPQPRRKTKWLWFGLMVLALAALIVAEALIHSGTSANERSIDKMLKQTPWLTMYFGVIWAPILEELIFRGLYFDFFFMKLQKRWVWWLGVVLNGVLFAMLHTSLWSPSAWVYGTMGMILAITYLKTKDIRFDIGIHFLNNGFAMLASFL